MSPNDPVQCSTCTYWQQKAYNPNQGLCMQRPSTPTTRSDEVCDQYVNTDSINE